MTTESENETSEEPSVSNREILADKAAMFYRSAKTCEDGYVQPKRIGEWLYVAGARRGSTSILVTVNGKLTGGNPNTLNTSGANPLGLSMHKTTITTSDGWVMYVFRIKCTEGTTVLVQRRKGKLVEVLWSKRCPGPDMKWIDITEEATARGRCTSCKHAAIDHVTIKGEKHSPCTADGCTCGMLELPAVGGWDEEQEVE